jgi:sensor histidine kinase regulating citrate/malate metabolism
VIAHVVLFRPRADLTEAARRDLLEGLAAAATDIPTVRRFHVGRRVLHGLPGYEQAVPQAFDYSAIVEFDDRDGLRAYLAHPAHQRIGEHFTASAEAALAFDYEMVPASNAARLGEPDRS